MLRKIYFNSKPLFLVSQITSEVEDYLHHEDTVFIDEFNSHTVKAMIHEMEQPQIHAGVFLHEDVESLLRSFRKKLVPVEAAGGLVYTPDHELLLIFRHGKWDLPKGKLDPGEDLRSCAIREVKEETGLQEAVIEKELHVTYHTYHQDGRHILKESHWYLMKADHQQLLPQVEEGIDKCIWVPVKEIAGYMELTYPLVAEVVKEGITALHEVKNV